MEELPGGVFSIGTSSIRSRLVLQFSIHGWIEGFVLGRRSKMVNVGYRVDFVLWYALVGDLGLSTSAPTVIFLFPVLL